MFICTYVLTDGKIDGPYDSDYSGQYYSDELFRLSDADGNGRETIQMYAAPAEIDLSPYDSSNIEYEDWLPKVEAETWSVAFDRKGKDGWPVNYFEYNGHKMHAIEVVTRQAKKEYLAFLRSMGIPYIVSGDASKKAAFDTLGDYVDDNFEIKDVKKLKDGGLHLIFSKK